MELQILNNQPSPALVLPHSYTPSEALEAYEMEEMSTAKPFIQANTISVSLAEIKNEHIIPVYIKDNEVLISHTDFIESTMQIASELFRSETILRPNIRVSHPIKGKNTGGQE